MSTFYSLLLIFLIFLSEINTAEFARNSLAIEDQYEEIDADHGRNT